MLCSISDYSVFHNILNSVYICTTAFNPNLSGQNGQQYFSQISFLDALRVLKNTIHYEQEEEDFDKWKYMKIVTNISLLTA